MMEMSCGNLNSAIVFGFSTPINQYLNEEKRNRLGLSEYSSEVSLGENDILEFIYGVEIFEFGVIDFSKKALKKIKKQYPHITYLAKMLGRECKIHLAMSTTAIKKEFDHLTEVELSQAVYEDAYMLYTRSKDAVRRECENIRKIDNLNRIINNLRRKRINELKQKKFDEQNKLKKFDEQNKLKKNRNNELLKKRRGRQIGHKSSTYYPYCSFKSFDIAKSILKTKFLESRWKQLNKVEGRWIWFMCNSCNQRIKLWTRLDGRCLVLLNSDYWKKTVNSLGLIEWKHNIYEESPTEKDKTHDFF